MRTPRITNRRNMKHEHSATTTTTTATPYKLRNKRYRRERIKNPQCKEMLPRLSKLRLGDWSDRIIKISSWNFRPSYVYSKYFTLETTSTIPMLIRSGHFLRVASYSACLFVNISTREENNIWKIYQEMNHHHQMR